MNRRAQIYNDAVTHEFSFLKESSTLEETFGKAIYVAGGEGALLPVCRLHLQDECLIQQLSDWREKYAFAYPSRFPVSFEGTRLWLEEKVLNVSDRILFLVLDNIGRIVGHMGFANCFNDELAMEIDNVVRGISGTAPGIMSVCLRRLIKWANTTLWPAKIFLRVLDDNEHAQQFYQNIGFIEVDREPLRKRIMGDVVRLNPIEAGDNVEPDAHFVKMKWQECSEAIGNSMILTAGPSISAREGYYAWDAAKYGWNNSWNKYLSKFELHFSQYVQTKYALATSCCTGALHIALAALGIGPGDEVIVPDLTWVATANAVLYVGATPIFADVEAGSWCLDPNSFESCITPMTKAVIPVHLYGHPCDMDSILRIAEKHGLYVIEDAAPSIGAEYKGHRTGSFGHFAAFSFQGAKLAVTGEGGMLVTSDNELYRKARQIWDQGRRPGTFWIEKNGLKYKMSNVQAAIGLAQLERNDSMVEAKRCIFSWYEENLKDLSCVTLNQEMPWAHSIYWMSSLCLNEDSSHTRDELMRKLKERNIDTRPVFPAISQFPIWPREQEPQHTAFRIGNQAINLPSGVCLKKEQVEYVCRSIKRVLADCK